MEAESERKLTWEDPDGHGNVRVLRSDGGCVGMLSGRSTNARYAAATTAAAYVNSQMPGVHSTDESPP
ncbi:hypothetical protein H7J93_09650 [Mycobacterium barrassiae]|jgi:hypothetical protein|uniref:hypothetical protein n=1 Tax=Mycobacterium barrassiae TaxID=319709 RepID=UPI002265DD3F|nr:hypothetical protein [Mycobacterium barrassiae]MCV7299900.1 hypothetical protein [Mycobacterium barrassiae]